MKAKAYVRLPTWFLNKRKICQLSDNEWRKFIIDYVYDPVNIRYEDYRNSWNVVRKKMTKLVMGRDKNECNYCGSTDHLQIDHIYPMVRGGSNDLDNLQILCRKCNVKKSAKVYYVKK